MTQFVALLRGINAGVSVKMQVLREIFEQLGFTNVETVLATGNILFWSTGTPAELELKIEEAVRQRLQYRTIAIVQPLADLQRLYAQNPFQGHALTPSTVPQVTFIKANQPLTAQTYPIQGTGYTIIGAYDHAICSVVDLTGATTPDLMAALDRQYKKATTTRNWKTIDKIIKKGATHDS